MLDLARRYHGDFGIPAGESEGLQMQGWYATGVQQLQAVIGNTENMNLDNGGVVQRAWRFLGEIHASAAWLYRTVTESMDKSYFKHLFQESVDAYRVAANEGNFPGVDVRDISAARSSLIARLMERAELYNPWWGESVTDADRIAATVLFDEAYDEWAQLMAGAVYEDGERVWATLELGRGVIWLWNLLVGELAAGENMDSIPERLELGLQLFEVITNEYSWFDQGRTAAEALYYAAELYERAAYAEESKGNNTCAITYWDEGIILLEKLRDVYSARTDWWVVNNAVGRLDHFRAEKTRLDPL
jgi:hypothetical protein